jgi:hypothetical protein
MVIYFQFSVLVMINLMMYIFYLMFPIIILMVHISYLIMHLNLVRKKIMNLYI